jgi:hypothetical protein
MASLHPFANANTPDVILNARLPVKPTREWRLTGRGGGKEIRKEILGES